MFHSPVSATDAEDAMDMQAIFSRSVVARLKELFIHHPTPPSSKADRHVFLCHGSADKSFARRLADDLDRLGVTPWIDEWEIGPGDSLFAKIGSGISQTGFFCVILSKTSAHSNWCRMELEEALAQQLLNKLKIIPFKIDDVKVPPFLGAAHYLHIKRGHNREVFRLAAKTYGISERAVDTFLRAFPDPLLKASTSFLTLATTNHDLHFGKDWVVLQTILEKKGIRPSDRYIIRGRDGKDFGAA
jgi:TIR domain